jgi:hypothetical protein
MFVSYLFGGRTERKSVKCTLHKNTQDTTDDATEENIEYNKTLKPFRSNKMLGTNMLFGVF